MVELWRRVLNAIRVSGGKMSEDGLSYIFQNSASAEAIHQTLRELFEAKLTTYTVDEDFRVCHHITPDGEKEAIR